MKKNPTLLPSSEVRRRRAELGPKVPAHQPSGPSRSRCGLRSLEGAFLGSLVCLLMVSLAQASPVDVGLRVELLPDSSLSLTWNDLGPSYDQVIEFRDSLDADSPWQPVSGAPHNTGGLVVTHDLSERFFRLVATARLSAVSGHTPLDGATDVGLTVTPQVFFSKPVDPATINTNNFYATFGGQRLAGNIVSAADGTFAWLFLTDPMPGGAQIEVTLDGTAIVPLGGGRPLDADGDGAEGGVLRFSFTTVSAVPMVGTVLAGRVVDPGPDLAPRTLDDIAFSPGGLHFLHPIAGVKVYLLGLEDQAVFTDSQGWFSLNPAPVGDVKLVLSGPTATSPHPDFYWPEMVMDTHNQLGITNYVTMIGQDTNALLLFKQTIYLPRIASNVLQTVSGTNTTILTLQSNAAYNLTPEQQPYLTIGIPPNSLIGPGGVPLASGQVGVSVVPPELVQDMLPPGVLQHTFDITVQAPGISKFSTPAPMTFPNVFNAAPGTQLNFLSFDHTTGKLVIEGTATVSADGLAVHTDPGTGVTHPGWHGLTPPGGPNDPTCPPIDTGDDIAEAAIARVTVADEPFLPLGKALVTTGIQDYLFIGDKGPDGKDFFIMTFANETEVSGLSSSCNSASKLTTVVTLKVLDRKWADQFLDGLPSGKFLLRPGMQQKFKVNLLPLHTLDNLKQARGDRLHGAKLEIEAHTLGSKTQVKRAIYIYSLFDAADDDHSDGAIDFPLTFADGRFGNYNTLGFESHMAAAARPGFDTTGDDFKVPLGFLVFDPLVTTAVRQLKQETMTLYNPDTKAPIGQINLRGVAANKQRILFPRDDFKAAITNLVDRKTLIPGTSDLISAVFPDDSNGDGIRSNEPGFDDVVETLYNDVASRVILSFHPGPNLPDVVNLSPAIDLVDSTSSPGILVHSAISDALLPATTIPPGVHLTGVQGNAVDAIDREYVDFVISGVTLDPGASLKISLQQALGQVITLNTVSWTNELQRQVTEPTQRFTYPVTVSGARMNWFRAVSEQMTGTSATYEVEIVPHNGVCDASASGCATWVDFNRRQFNDDQISPKSLGSLDQKEYDFVGKINQDPSDIDPTYGNSLTLLLDVNAAPDFESFTKTLANVLLHEIGHDLGAIHQRDRVLEYLSDTKDVMGEMIGRAQGLYGFTTLRPAIKAALGYGNTYQQIREIDDYYRLFDPLEEFRHNDGVPGVPPSEAPEGFAIGSGILSLYAAPLSVGGPLPSVVSEVSMPPTVADGPGGQSGTNLIVLINSGDQDLHVSLISLEQGNTGFSLEGVAQPPLTLPPLDPNNLQPALSSLAITVRFDPSLAGSATDTLRIESDSLGGGVKEIPLSGIAIAPTAAISVLVGNNNLGGAAIGGLPGVVTNFATVTNLGSQPLVVTQIRTAPGAGQGQFNALNLPALPITLQPNQSFAFDAAFSPSSTGLQRGELQILSNDPNIPLHHLHVMGTGLAASGNPFDTLDYGNDYVALETPDVPNAPVLRMKSDAQGNWSFFLPPNERYRAVIFDPVSGLVAHLVGVTAQSGKNTPMGVPVFLPSTDPDTDGDGLPDDAEFAVGTSPTKVDTDGDGIDDFASVQQGLDPLGGRAFPTGVIASVPLAGEAKEVVVAASTQSPGAILAYVAMGQGGLAIVDISQFDKPLLLGQISLPGDATDVAVDPFSQVAVVTANAGGIHLVDISDPAKPDLLQTLDLPATQVEVAGNVAYVGTDTAIREIEPATGITLQVLPIPGAPIVSLAREGNMLYTLDSSGLLRAVDISGWPMVLHGSLAVDGAPQKVFVGNGTAYLAIQPQGVSGGGYATVDVSNPDQLALVAGSQVPSGIRAPGTSMVANGSGMGLLIGSSAGANVLDLMDVSNPTNTYSFLTRFTLPAPPNSVAIASGLGFVADGTAGLQIVNYLGFDTLGQPPTVALNTAALDVNTNLPGIQVFAGSTVQIQAAVQDDVQVRSVDLLVNGQVVQRAFSNPLNLSFIVPPYPAQSNQVMVQVRATDTGGNVTLTDPLLLDVAPDTTPPRLLASSELNDGAVRFKGFSSIRLVFSKPILAEGLTTNATVLNSFKNSLFPQKVTLLNNNQVLELAFGAFPPESYRLVIPGGGIVDRNGNPLDTNDTVIHFVVCPLAQQDYTFRWLGQHGLQDDGVHFNVDFKNPDKWPLGGFDVSDPKMWVEWFGGTNTDYDAMENWVSSGRVPGPTNNVYIGPIRFGKQEPVWVLRTNSTPISFALANLVSEAPVRFSNVSLAIQGTFVLNDTLEVAGPASWSPLTLMAGRQVVVTESFAGIKAFTNLTLVGDFDFQDPSGLYKLIDHLTLRGTVRRLGLENQGQTSATLDGLGTFVDCVLNSELQTNSTLTIASNMTWRGASSLVLGVGCAVTNRGSIIVETNSTFPDQATSRFVVPAGFDFFGDYGPTNILTGNTFVNEGNIEVRKGSILYVQMANGLGLDPHEVSFSNQGSLKVHAGGSLRIADSYGGGNTGAQWSSAVLETEPGAEVILQAHLVTAENETSVLSGGGTWLVHAVELGHDGFSLLPPNPDGAMLRGGTVNLTNGAVLQGSLSLNNVTLNGDLALTNNRVDYSINILGDVVVNGRMTLGDTNGQSAGYLLFGGGSQDALGYDSGSLSGNAQLEFGTSLLNIISHPQRSTKMTLGPDVKVHGGVFTIGYNSGFGGYSYATKDMTFINQGTIEVEGTNGMASLVTMAGGRYWLNTGSITARNGSLLNLVTLSSTWTNRGSITAIGATIEGAADFYQEGTLHLDAQSQMNVQGYGATGLHVPGNYTQSPSGQLFIDVGGTVPGSSYGQLNVTNRAGLGGALNLNLVNGFLPQNGDVFDVVTWASSADAFDTITGTNASGGIVLKPDYQPAGLRLTAGSP